MFARARQSSQKNPNRKGEGQRGTAGQTALSKEFSQVLFAEREQTLDDSHICIRVPSLGRVTRCVPETTLSLPAPALRAPCELAACFARFLVAREGQAAD